MSTSAADLAIARFERERDRYERAGRAVVSVLREALGPAGLAPHITSRAKDLASFRQKIAVKGYEDPWRQITDKVGVRAVVERAGDVDRIHQALVDDGRLAIYDRTDKRAQLQFDSLGYSGLHLDVYAPAEEGDTERVPCEIQIRTVAQDAWSVVSHKLVYKPHVELPDTDKRAIMRLVALMELFDGEVERVMDKAQSLAALEAPAPAPVDLLELVTAQYARFEDTPGHPELSHLVLEAVGSALAADGVDDYVRKLRTFVDEHRQPLQSLYDDYGPRSAMATSSDYVLWSQPESLAVLESLEHRQHRLKAAWLEAELPVAWLRSLADHTSADLDLD
ncbi:GTP pyrophosphokinase [Nocardioides lacusdianchii]|uniref:GTP pyrophosphokinase n=1 Tax=Nocardioides lacusdianchii TaxID=2783664 RepID=UPI001CCF2153|nr:RelA/SpoT domain-containing protein [Nocardioides lacusdianchii]